MFSQTSGLVWIYWFSPLSSLLVTPAGQTCSWQVSDNKHECVCLNKVLFVEFVGEIWHLWFPDPLAA